MRTAYLTVVSSAVITAAIITIALRSVYQVDAPCVDQVIETKAQAVEFAKNAISSGKSAVARSGFANGRAYIVAIEQNPNCCDASYGPYEIEGSGIGWNVQISAFGVPNEFQHELEFDKCGAIIYNGGLNWGPANRTP
ncbi:hypothetical protein [Methylorubrum sp. POS3]|uniref:hypothetical protein n=1 Tax=Methylorubrum sp. POS3 TaxID=2998492 RepID=UPI00372BEAB9